MSMGMHFGGVADAHYGDPRIFTSPACRERPPCRSASHRNGTEAVPYRRAVITVASLCADDRLALLRLAAALLFLGLGQPRLVGRLVLVDVQVAAHPVVEAAAQLSAGD